MNKREAQKITQKIINALMKEKERRGITNYTISQKTGVSQSSLSNIQKHLQDPSLSMTILIADAIGINLSETIKKVEDSQK